MKRYITSAALALLACSLSTYAQHVVVHFKSGEKANLGTLYTENPHFYVGKADEKPIVMYEGQCIGTPQNVDSISIIPQKSAVPIRHALFYDGRFKYTIRLLDEFIRMDSYAPNYTLFPASDEAWERFFASDNAWGVHCYDSLSIAQKKRLLHASLVRGPFWVSQASSFINGHTLQFDSEIALKPSEIGTGLVQAYPSQQLSPLTSQMDEADRRILLPSGTNLQAPFYLCGIPPVSPFKEFICCNGSAYEMQELIVPVSTLEQLARMPECSLFYSFVEQLTMPCPLSLLIPVEMHSSFNLQEDMYDPLDLYEINYPLIPTLQLSRNPSVQRTLFAPTDSVLREWLYYSSEAYALTGNVYYTWEEVPQKWIAQITQNLIRKGMILPSEFHNMTEVLDPTDCLPDASILPEDIVKTHLCTDGIVYALDKVYSLFPLPKLQNKEAEEYNGWVSNTHPTIHPLKTDSLPMILANAMDSTWQNAEERWSISGNQYTFFAMKDDTVRCAIDFTGVPLGKYAVYVNFLPTSLYSDKKESKLVNGYVRYASGAEEKLPTYTEIPFCSMPISDEKVTRMKLAEIEVGAFIQQLKEEELYQHHVRDPNNGESYDCSSWRAEDINRSLHSVRVYVESSKMTKNSLGYYHSVLCIDNIELVPIYNTPF